MAPGFRSSLQNARRQAGRDRGCLAIPWRSGRGGVVALARHDARGGRAPFTEPPVALHYFGGSAGSDIRSCTALIRLGPPKAVDIDCVDARSATTRTEKFRLASSSQPTRK